ncbi:hypothetical protein ACET3Z_006172 [Daucus carota]
MTPKPMLVHQNLRHSLNIHRRIHHHLSPRHIRQKLARVVRKLLALERGRELQKLARLGRLGAGFDIRRADERALVEDGEDGGVVGDGDVVGVGDVDGHDDFGV